MSQRFASFTDVDHLDAVELNALLVDGEPPERVWAAWALGLRHDVTFAHDLRATAAEEPDPGVRRHLIVILAGAGQKRSVQTLAIHDPDERVRATALQYVARLAAPDEFEANDLLARTLAAGTPLLQLGCIAGLREDAPLLLWRAAEDCVASPDRDLRWTAYETVLRHGSSRSSPELAREFLNVESEANARRQAVRVLHDRGGGEALHDLIGDGALDVRVLPDVVDLLHDQGVRLPWEDVAVLLARSPVDSMNHLALKLLDGAEGAARPHLLELFVSDRLNPGHSWKMRSELTFRLRNALDQNRAPLDASESTLRQQLADFVDQVAAGMRADPSAYFEDIDVEYLSKIDTRDNTEPIDPFALPWFCQDEREILTRLAPLDVH
jgi:HEAT repeats